MDCPWNSPGQNIGVGSFSLLQGIFPPQELNPSLPHCRCILYQLSHKGSPRTLVWVAYPFSMGSSWPRNWLGGLSNCRQILYHLSHQGRPESESCSVLLNFLQPHGLSPWNSPGQNTGVGSSSLLQGIFPTQRSNPGLPHCRQIHYKLSHKGRPRILEWLAYPFSSRSSRLKNQTGVSCITGRFLSTGLYWELSW